MKSDKGKEGEKQAKDYLIKKGYKVISQNFRSKFGEIDIIAEKDSVIIFVEVKFRQGKSFEGASGAVHHKKIQKLILTANYWISLKGIEVNSRFDVIAIDNKKITHIENAFTV